jgi:hypothetical protein
MNVKCTSGFLGRCLSHSFGISSSKQDFLDLLDFNAFTSSCLSYGLTLSSTDGSRVAGVACLDAMQLRRTALVK